jgi:hypothetical protein
VESRREWLLVHVDWIRTQTRRWDSETVAGIRTRSTLQLLGFGHISRRFIAFYSRAWNGHGTASMAHNEQRRYDARPQPPYYTASRGPCHTRIRAPHDCPRPRRRRRRRRHTRAAATHIPSPLAPRSDDHHARRKASRNPLIDLAGGARVERHGWSWGERTRRPSPRVELGRDN